MQKIILPVASYTVSVFASDTSEKSIFYLPTSAAEAERAFSLLSEPKPILAAIDGLDWACDLSPWQAPRAFGDGTDFGGGEEQFLAVLTERIIPETEKSLGITPRCRGLVGYSLAGLFAVWATYRVDCFDRVASVSGSLWFDGFLDFMRGNVMRKVPDVAYFSLGKQEKHVKNARMRAVEDCTAAAVSLMEAAGAETRFVLHDGGHFHETAERTAAALRFLAER